MSNSSRTGKLWAIAIVLSATLAAAAAQEGKPRPPRPGLTDQGGEPLKNARPDAADPLNPNANANAKGKGKNAAKNKEKAKDKDAEDKPAAKVGVTPFHYTFKLHSFDGAALAASYYPSKLGSTAPILILVHEANRSRKDFEDPVLELKGQGLAEHLQDQGYAVLSYDLRGRGQTLRQPAANNADDLETMADDLQAAYQFLLDRHNRGELNVGKLGVIGMGEGANLAAAWAYQPGAAVSTEGRASDLNDLILVSPEPEGSGYVLDHVLAPLAPRVPMLLMAGEKDKASHDAVESARKSIARSQLSKIEPFPSSLHGFKLLRLEPKAATTLIRHLDSTLKLRPAEWEPRYNQFPIAVTDVKTIQRRAPEKPEAEEKAKAEEKPKAKAEEKPKDKAEEKPKDKAEEKPKAEEPRKKTE